VRPIERKPFAINSHLSRLWNDRDTILRLYRTAKTDKDQTKK
jgi:hypothetical protein